LTGDASGNSPSEALGNAQAHTPDNALADALRELDVFALIVELSGELPLGDARDGDGIANRCIHDGSCQRVWRVLNGRSGNS
jgi:hypothetical protein